MRFLTKFIALSLVATGALGAASAHEISPFLGINWNHISYQPADQDTITARAGVAGGVLGAYSLLPRLDLESGLIFLRRTYRDTNPVNQEGDASISYLEIPMAVRYWIWPQLGAGAGIYYARAVSDVTTTTQNGSVSAPLGDSNTETHDFGMLASLRARYPLAHVGISPFADFRYQLGLTNLSKSTTPGVSVSYRDVQILVGVSIPLGTPKAEPSPTPTPTVAPSPEEAAPPVKKKHHHHHKLAMPSPVPSPS